MEPDCRHAAIQERPVIAAAHQLRGVVVVAQAQKLRDELVIVCARNVLALLEGSDPAFAASAANGQRPRRSMLFAAWNPEERGLLGACHVQHGDGGRQRPERAFESSTTRSAFSSSFLIESISGAGCWAASVETENRMARKSQRDS